jgi:formylglycine-generating enzyme required for sulfatase activity
MLGNVFEWCSDHWHDGYNGAPDDGSAWIDAGAPDGAGRVIRGGSWGGEARLCRAAYRFRIRPDYRVGNVGFRPARGQG